MLFPPSRREVTWGKNSNLTPPTPMYQILQNLDEWKTGSDIMPTELPNRGTLGHVLPFKYALLEVVSGDVLLSFIIG